MISPAEFISFKAAHSSEPEKQIKSVQIYLNRTTLRAQNEMTVGGVPARYITKQNISLFNSRSRQTSVSFTHATHIWNGAKEKSTKLSHVFETDIEICGQRKDEENIGQKMISW